MVRKAQIEIKKELRGGKGEVEFHHILTQEELNGHGSMYAMVRLKPGCSIGISSAHREHRTIFYFGGKRYVCR